MFGTLRLDSECKNAEFIAQADGKAFSQMGCSLPPHSACDKCRAKKLKCSGQKTGCNRCKASRIKCTYSLISDAVERRRRHAARSKAQRKSVDDSGSLGETSRPQTSFITAGDSVQIPDAASTQPAKVDASTAYDAFQPSELPILDDINFHDLLPVHEEEDFSMTSLCLPLLELPDFGLVEGGDGRSHMPCAPDFGVCADRGCQANAHATASCCCLQIVVQLLEELENQTHGHSTKGLDTVLAWQKDACNSCMIMLRCAKCSVRSEYITLLTIICDKLATLSCRLVGSCLPDVSISGNSNVGSAGELSNVWKLGNDDRAAHTMFVGDYEIDDSDEWSCIIRGLLVVQLQRLQLLILEIEAIAMKEAMNTQVTMLRYAKQQVVQLIEGHRH